MRILQVANWYIPEYGYQEYFLADSWQRMGHDVRTITGTKVYPHAEFGRIEGLVRRRKVAPGRYQESGTNVYRLRCVELLGRVKLSTKLESLVRDFMPDMVLVHGVTTLSSWSMPCA